MPVEPKARSRAVSLTDEERVQLALDYYQGYAEAGSPRSLSELSKKYKNAKPVVLSRNIKRAFRDNLVKVERVTPSPGVSRKREMELKLKSKFGLRDAIVIPSTPAQSSSDADPLHQNLGKVMAEYLAKNGFFFDGDSLGLGSGRAVFNTLRALPTYGQLKLQGVSIVSLSGSAYPMHDAGRRGYFLDADLHVGLLATLIEDKMPPQLRFVTNQLVIADADRMKAVKSGTHLHHEKWKEAHPNVALIGVGTMSPTHRFWDAVEKPGMEELVLKPIAEDLKNLVDLCKKYIQVDRYSPVADTCNHLFFVPPPQGHALSKQDEADIKRLISKVNQMMLTVEDDQFRSIPRVALVAGTREKTYAILTLLTNENYHVRLLCTDHDTAQSLLGAEFSSM